MRIKVMVAALAVLFSMFSPLVIIARDRETEEIPQSEIENEQLFLYSRSGQQSVSGCKSLEKLGFTNVTNLGGVVD